VVDWFFGSDERVQGEFSFFVGYSPSEPEVGCTLEVQAFQDREKTVPLACSVKWFREFREQSE
jgi:hypothetical protein